MKPDASVQRRLRWAGIAVALTAAACSGSDGDLVAFCSTAQFDAAFDGAFDLDPVDIDVDEAIDQFESAVQIQRDLKSQAPKAAREDIDVIIDFVEDLLAGLEAYQADPPQIEDDSGRDPQPEIFTTLRDRAAEVDDAGKRLDRYVTNNCSDVSEE